MSNVITRPDRRRNSYFSTTVDGVRYNFRWDVKRQALVGNQHRKHTRRTITARELAHRLKSNQLPLF